ncbi:MAG: hypothetical protein IH987_08525 [Planctomycetes bacterium]|nr:hypothetical protein [Planctomycetota bacterium]
MWANRVRIPFYAALTLSVAGGAFAGQVIYVNDDASGANNGSSWNDAFVTVQDAIAQASSGDQVWVAAGVYYPDGVGPPLDRNASIVLKDAVELYGGFAGNESALADRDFQTHQSILSGDLLGNDEPVNCNTDGECQFNGRYCVSGACVVKTMIDDNSYTVVTADGMSSATVLDGFIVTGGHANGSFQHNGPRQYGAGMYVRYVDGPTPVPSEPMIRNCRFEWNSARVWGGALFVQAHPSAPDGPYIEGCMFFRNSSLNPDVSLGGALYNLDTDTRLDQCTFENNLAAGGLGGFGGAIGTQNLVLFLSLGRFASMKINRCTFINNRTDGYGGAMYDSHNDTVFRNCTFVGNRAKMGGAYSNVGGTPTVVNSVFVGNAATELSPVAPSRSGGALAMPGSDRDQEATIVNCLFVNNYAVDTGGGIYWKPLDNPAGIRRIANSILIGNTAGGSPNQIFVDAEVPELAPEVTYSNVEGGFTGEGNIDVDPLFVDVAGPDAIVGTEDDNLHLSPGSPCIDAGDNGIVISIGIATDIEGLPRRVDDCDTVDTGGGEPPNVDIGPHEFSDDTDGDGVCDSEDICPGGDDNLDMDGDGVPDDCDPCPSDDPDDTDGDGVCESADVCPGSDDTIDSDGDGVPDGCDLCPGSDDRMDADADSVPDDCDRCPGSDDTIDTDGDGLPDDCDICDNRFPDSCAFSSPIQPPPPHDILKIRYLSIDHRGDDAENVGVGYDIQIELSATLVNGVTAVGSNWWALAPDANCISVVGWTRRVNAILS